MPQKYSKAQHTNNIILLKAEKSAARKTLSIWNKLRPPLKYIQPTPQKELSERYYVRYKSSAFGNILESIRKSRSGERFLRCFPRKIHIAPLAVKTAGHQLHKALYLDGKAQLDCKPELEIFADDVKCSHGASCGEINKDQLFYLMSRGIDQASAIRILTEAHLNEIIELIPNEKIRTEFCA